MPLAGDDTVKNTIDVLLPKFLQMKRDADARDELEKKQRLAANLKRRDESIIKLVEDDAANGIAPLATMRKEYFNAINRIKEYEKLSGIGWPLSANVRLISNNGKL